MASTFTGLGGLGLKLTLGATIAAFVDVLLTYVFRGVLTGFSARRTSAFQGVVVGHAWTFPADDQRGQTLTCTGR